MPAFHARATALALLAALAGGCMSSSSETGTGPERPTYRNPVFRHDAPDPAVIRAPDGYYAYTTQSIYLDIVHIPVLHSPDLVHWRQVADALPQIPDWVVGGSGGDMWAPHVIRHRGRYLLYYSARRYVGDMAIGVAWSQRPQGPFHDLGRPLLTRERGQPPYTAIDPFVTRAGGRLLLLWGSNDEPIRAAVLSRDGMRVTGRPHVLVEPVSGAGPYTGLVEGPWLLEHGGWWYLLYSVGDCCSEEANYSVYVARSRSPLGPYTPGPDNPILHETPRFWAVGHNSTIADAAGDDWIVYHARVRGSFSDDRELMIDRIDWRDGWPTVNGGAGASSNRRAAPRA